jgi:hypothetical protein
VIEARRVQVSFAEGLIAGEVSDLLQDWTRRAGQVLDDDRLLTTVRPLGHAGRSVSAIALANPHPQLDL